MATINRKTRPSSTSFAPPDGQDAISNTPYFLRWGGDSVRDKQIPSRALQRAMQNRADRQEKEAAKRLLPARVLFAGWNLLWRTTVGLATIAGIASAYFWVLEAPDRAEERLVRRSQLISDARAVLDAAQLRPVIDGISNPSISAAVQTLADFGQPVVITADRVFLEHLRLECAEIEIKSRTLDLFDTYFGSSVLYWNGDEVELTNIIAEDSVLQFGPEDLKLDDRVTVTIADTLIHDTNLSLPTNFEIEPIATRKPPVLIRVIASQNLDSYSYPRLNGLSGLVKFPIGTCVRESPLQQRCAAVGPALAFVKPPRPKCTRLPMHLMPQHLRESSERLEAALKAREDTK